MGVKLICVMKAERKTRAEGKTKLKTQRVRTTKIIREHKAQKMTKGMNRLGEDKTYTLKHKDKKR